jgi:hypothetical protein
MRVRSTATMFTCSSAFPRNCRCGERCTSSKARVRTSCDRNLPVCAGGIGGSIFGAGDIGLHRAVTSQMKSGSAISRTSNHLHRTMTLKCCSRRTSTRWLQTSTNEATGFSRWSIHRAGCCITPHDARSLASRDVQVPSSSTCFPTTEAGAPSRRRADAILMVKP